MKIKLILVFHAIKNFVLSMKETFKNERLNSVLSMDKVDIEVHIKVTGMSRLADDTAWHPVRCTP